MSNISLELKLGRSADTSDLLGSLKRNTAVAVYSSKDSVGKRKSMVKVQGFNSGFFYANSKKGLDYYNADPKSRGVVVTAILTSTGGSIGSIRVTGYTVGSLTQADLDAFKVVLAAKIGVSPNLITIRISSGSLILEVFARPVDNISELSLKDKTFFVNSESVIRSIQSDDIDECVTQSGISSSIINKFTNSTIDNAYTTFNNDLDISRKCRDDPDFISKKVADLCYPLVGDPINNCIYTLISNPGTNDTIVRINTNGTMDKIGDYVENKGCQAIFINADSTYLIIPSNVDDTTSQNGADASIAKPNKVYLFNIVTGDISTITLTDLDIKGCYGFDKAKRRFFYGSFMKDTFWKMVFVTIPADYSSATLSATSTTKSHMSLQFVDSNTAYGSLSTGIVKFEVDASGIFTSRTVVAGIGMSNGVWTNDSKKWYNEPLWGPFADSSIGTNAFFSYIWDIAYDSEENRLLVTDGASHRIRSVDLRPGNNYAVTTLAGTSPTFSGLARNDLGITSFSQTLLDTLQQVGEWNNGINAMPPYTKVNGPYLTSTFNFPSSILIFNNKIFISELRSSTVRQLSNGIVTDFAVSYNNNTAVIARISIASSLLGSIKINGYTIGNITQDDIDRFTLAFASKYKVNPTLITIQFSAGSLIMDVYSNNVTNVTNLNTSDKAFFANSPDTFTNMSASDVSEIVSTSKIPATSISQTGPLYVEPTYTQVNRSASIVSLSSSDPILLQNVVTNFPYPIVGSDLNNCMYTLIPNPGTNDRIVRINLDGTMDLITNHVENQGCKQIFLSDDFIDRSAHLIIPSNVYDTISPDAINNDPRPNKVYIVNIATGQINTITLTDLNKNDMHGFEPSSRRYFFGSFMRNTYNKIGFVTIPADYSSAALSPSYFTNGLAGDGKMIFVAGATPGLVGTEGYYTYRSSIIRASFTSLTDNYTTVVAGYAGDYGSYGKWINNNLIWYTSPSYGPYLDDTNGTGAFFSNILDISITRSNNPNTQNKIFVADGGSQRIRYIDLADGKNFEVATFAGISPVLKNNAVNGSNSTFPQNILDSLGQVGDWGTNNMPPYEKFNSIYLNTPFNNPNNIIFVNDKIFVKDNVGIRQLSNGNVTDFKVISNIAPPNTVGGSILGSVSLSGYIIGTLSPSNKDAMTAVFSNKYGVSSSLINANFSSGVPTFTITSLSTNFSNLSLSDKTFFANTDAIIRGIQPSDINNIVTSANIPSNVINISSNAFIRKQFTEVNSGLDIVTKSKNDSDLKSNTLSYVSLAFVADPINDCIYSVQYLNILGVYSWCIVKINKSGIVTKISDLKVPTVPPSNMFINSDSTYLIIPSNNAEVYSNDATNNPSANKVELVNISTGIITSITLLDLNVLSVHGFDASTRRFYYGSNMTLKFGRLCYVTIPENYSSATLAATYFNDISVGGTGQLQFLNSTTAYSADLVNIRKYDLSVPGGINSLIAGRDRVLDFGYWSNDQVQWYTEPSYGPYLDAPIGINAFFSSITDICIDIPNNRLLVVDQSAQRIRSVDLTPGNNYAVTTLAGSSPTLSGVAVNPIGNPLFTQDVLDSLLQVGRWSSNNMPAYTSVNGLYLNSTFNNPQKLILSNRRMYVIDGLGIEIKQLSNDYVSDFTLVQNISSNDVTLFYANEVIALATIRLDGYDYVTDLTSEELSTFKSALALQFGGVNPELLVLVLRIGSVIMDISVDYSKIVFKNLSDNDKSFFVNSDAILSSFTTTKFDSIISASNTGSSIVVSGSTPKTVTTTIINQRVNGQDDYKLKNDCLNDLNTRKSLAQFPSAVVADPINDCMYTMINSDVVKIFNNGTMRKVALLSNFLYGCKFMFINSTSTHLIIPYYEGFVDQNTANSSIYLVELGSDDGAVKIITLDSYDGSTTYGFDKLTNKLYYCSTLLHPTNKKELCYITISDYTQDATLSATFNFSNFNASVNDLTTKGKIEFVNSNTAYFIDRFAVNKLDFSVTDGALSFIAGHVSFNGSDVGYWTNIYPNITWGTERKLFAPYLDGDGNDAFFSLITDISYDSANNRLLVCDFGAQRIRSIDLSGSTYTVTTLAGTSPTLDNVARADDNVTYSEVLLNSLKQVGTWNNGINAMPRFTKTNKTFLTSTFKFPMGVVTFNGKIYIKTLDTLPYDDLTVAQTNVVRPTEYCTMRQLYNDTVSDLTGILTRSLIPNTSDVQLSASNIVSKFTNPAVYTGFFSDLDSFLQNTTTTEIVNVTSANLLTHYANMSGGTFDVPSSVYAVTGATIDPSVITTIALSGDSGFLIPASYPITVGSSTYQADSGTNTLTIITGGVTETKNPGDTYFIGGLPFKFLGTGSPALSAAFPISPDYGIVANDSADNPLVTVIFRNISIFSIRYDQPKIGRAFILGGQVNAPYEFNLADRAYTRRLTQTLMTQGPLAGRVEDRQTLEIDIPYADLVNQGFITKLLTYTDVFFHFAASNIAAASYKYDVLSRSPAISLSRPNFYITRNMENVDFTISFSESVRTVYLRLGTCRLVGGNTMAFNNGTSNPLNSIPITSADPVSLSSMISSGFITANTVYPNMYLEVTSREAPYTKFRSPILSFGVYKPIPGLITFDRITRSITYDGVLSELNLNCYTTLYINRREVRKYYTTGIGVLNIDTDQDIRSQIRPFAYNTAHFTITINNITSNESVTCPIDLRTPDIMNAINANRAYLNAISPAYSNGSVNMSIVTQTLFDIDRTANPPTACYYYYGPYLPNFRVPASYQISLDSGGNITTGKVAILDTGSDFNDKLVETITANTSFSEVISRLKARHRGGDPPGIFTVFSQNIFYVTSLTTNNQFGILTPNVGTKYCVILSRDIIKNAKSFRFAISITGTAGYAPVLLPAPVGTTQPAYGVLDNPSFTSFMFDLLPNKDYTLTFTDPVNATMIENARRNALVRAQSEDEARRNQANTAIDRGAANNTYSGDPSITRQTNANIYYQTN